MKRREFLKAVGVSAGALLMPRCTLPLGKGERKPNIVYILADDLGYGDLGCYGQEKIKTPNLDRMAAEGMRFTQHYAGSTVCAPSRCSLMTGLHCGHTYVRGNRRMEPEGQLPIPADTITVAKILKEAGYATAAVGKWGLGGPGSSGVPGKQGFDTFFGYLCQRKAHKYYAPSLWRNEEEVLIEGNQDGGQETYCHDLISEEALRFIREHKDEPFFLYLPFTIPHAEIIVPQDSLALYEGKFPEKPFKGGHYCAQQTPHAAFAAMVTRMDRDVGRIMALLKELGIDGNTLVMFSSDNGPHQEGGADPNYFQSSGPLRGIKRDLYEGGIRVPLICRWPGKIRPGSMSDHVSTFWDFLPTCAELAGVDPPEEMDGISMKPALLSRPGEQETHPYLYWEFHERGFSQAVRMGDWKAVRFFKKKENTHWMELYDLARDLGETQDIGDQHPEIVARMESILETARTPSEHFPGY